MTKTARLEIEDFAQIARADILFGDLTVFVGAQGTGKNLTTQWLKAALDGNHIVASLRSMEDTPPNASIIDLIFGEGMDAAWCNKSIVKFNGKSVYTQTASIRGGKTERALYIPSHRATLIYNGYASPLQLPPGTPAVARIFSQNLHDLLNANRGKRLFPNKATLMKVYRDQIDDAIFHGGKVVLNRNRQSEDRLGITYGESTIPFMAWTAGQRAFTPLLLGLDRLQKKKSIDWVIIEEPEMEQHPRSISAVLLLILDLLASDYRVVISTHSSCVLTAIWMLRILSERNARWQLVCDAFNAKPSQQLKLMMKTALEKTYSVYAFVFKGDGKVYSQDISSLDPCDEDNAISGWGGLTEFDSRFGDAVRRAVNESEQSTR